jgi:C-terminal processing protease CtpA/Prc
MKPALLLWIISAFAAAAAQESPKATPKTVPQVAASAILTLEMMRADLDYTVKILGNVHPATYHGFSDAQQKAIDEAYHRIEKPMSAKAFFFIVNSVICSLQDGHTRLRPIENSQNRRIDVPTIWLHAGHYVQAGRDPFQPGDRITAIAGQSIDRVFQKLRAIIPAENEHYRQWCMADMIQREEFLDYLGVVDQDAVKLTIDRAGKDLSFVAPLKPAAECWRQAGGRPWVDYKIDAGLSLGIFTLDECNINDQYLKTLRAFFAAVKSNHIQNIAVDVRRNGGGNSQVVNEFFKYLNIDKYQTFSIDVRYSKELAAIAGYTKTTGYLAGKPFQQSNRTVPDPDLIFKGKLFVLTSPMTFSSGNWFAVMVKDNGLGTVLGEPTGNAPSSYGDVPNFQMPNTGFWFSVSHKKFVRPNPGNDPADALYPDVLAWTTIDDIVRGTDPQLEKLKTIIRPL